MHIDKFFLQASMSPQTTIFIIKKKNKSYYEIVVADQVQKVKIKLLEDA